MTKTRLNSTLLRTQDILTFDKATNTVTMPLSTQWSDLVLGLKDKVFTEKIPIGSGLWENICTSHFCVNWSSLPFSLLQYSNWGGESYLLYDLDRPEKQYQNSFYEYFWGQRTKSSSDIKSTEKNTFPSCQYTFTRDAISDFPIDLKGTGFGYLRADELTKVPLLESGIHFAVLLNPPNTIFDFISASEVFGENMWHFCNMFGWIFALLGLLLSMQIWWLDGYRPGKKCCDNSDPDSQKNMELSRF